MKFLMPMIFCLIPGMVWAAGVNDYKDMYGDINVRYSEPKTLDKNDSVYVGLRGDMSFLNWENTYKNEAGSTLGSDSFNFKPVIGFDVFGGYKSDKQWRADLEIGYVGKYSESETEYYPEEEHTSLDFETFYVSMNGYYDFRYGLYAGLGAGIAFAETTIKSTEVTGGKYSKTSPMGAIMLGWTHKLDKKIDFDIRYRFSVFDAGKSVWATADGGWMNMDSGTVIDNSLSLGIRYSF